MSGRHILRDQLRVTEAELWTCLRSGMRPNRGGVEIPDETLPVELAYLLVHRAGLADHDVARLTRAQALERLQQHWAGPPG